MPGIDPRDDDALVEAANRGDERAFDALYLRHREWVIRVAWRLTRDHEASLDVLQETFGYLLSKFPGFKLTCPLRGFLYPVIRYRCAQAYSQKAGRPVSLGELQDEIASIPSPSEPSDDLPLTRVLRSLPRPQREVLTLRFVDGLTLNEIAAALRIPEGTVKSRIHKALQRLREDPLARKTLDP